MHLKWLHICRATSNSWISPRIRFRFRFHCLSFAVSVFFSCLGRTRQIGPCFSVDNRNRVCAWFAFFSILVDRMSVIWAMWWNWTRKCQTFDVYNLQNWGFRVWMLVFCEKNEIKITNFLMWTKCNCFFLILQN